MSFGCIFFTQVLGLGVTILPRLSKTLWLNYAG